MTGAAIPHFVLFSQIDRQRRTGGWRFSLRSTDGSTRLEAADREPDVRGERLELLTIVRGLEALDQPSRVTVCSASSYVQRGVRYGLEQWRASGWTWERYGEWVSIKNADLWQRLDRILQFHRVEFRRYRFDQPHSTPAPVTTRRITPRRDLEFSAESPTSENSSNRAARRPWRPSKARAAGNSTETDTWTTSTSGESPKARRWLTSLGRAFVTSI